MQDKTVSEIGEFELIGQLVSQLSMAQAVEVGPGDDAAVFTTQGNPVVSTDMMVEGVHFRKDWCTGQNVGRKLIARSLADLEAMGAGLVGCVVAVSIPEDLPSQWLMDFFEGLKQEAAEAEVSIVGGDLTRGEKIVATATVFGQTEGRFPILRGGARPGDIIAYRGRLGWAAAGLAALSRGFRSPRGAVNAYRCPVVPYGAGKQAAEAGAHAMIDVSDGLLADLRHIARRSNVEIKLASTSFEIAEQLQTVGSALNQDPLDFVLTGGEDHALVAAFEPGSVPEGWREIGSVAKAGECGSRVLVDGAEWDSPGGWTHF